MIKRYSLLIYFGLVFLISWGGAFLILGPGAFPPTALEFENLGGLFYLATLAGPSVAGVLLTRLVDGRRGLRDLLGRLGRWPAGPKWYAVALLPSDKAGILMRALVPALLVGCFEESGWTGFAVPHLRARYSMLATGLGVGVVSGAWHFPLFWKLDSFSATISLAILLVQLFSWLPPFRVLLVWIHDRTQSLPVVMMAHALVSLVGITLSPATLTGVRLLASLLASAAMMWILMAAVGITHRGALSRQPLRRSRV